MVPPRKEGSSSLSSFLVWVAPTLAAFPLDRVAAAEKSMSLVGTRDAAARIVVREGSVILVGITRALAKNKEMLESSSRDQHLVAKGIRVHVEGIVCV